MDGYAIAVIFVVCPATAAMPRAAWLYIIVPLVCLVGGSDVWIRGAPGTFRINYRNGNLLKMKRYTLTPLFALYATNC